MGENYINPGSDCGSDTCNNNAVIPIGIEPMDANKDYNDFVFETPGGMAQYKHDVNGKKCLVTQDQAHGPMSCTYGCEEYSGACAVSL